MMILRQETEKDFQQIYDLVKVAFQTAKVSNEKEQDFINQLRVSSNYIPELALVAEKNDKMVGHIILTKTFIVNKDSKCETLFLGPVSVVLEYRNKGVGSALINQSINSAKEMGYKSVVLVGDPAYYKRFGFKKSIDYGIRHVFDIPEEYVMVLELVPHALDGISGTFNC